MVNEKLIERKQHIRDISIQKMSNARAKSIAEYTKDFLSKKDNKTGIDTKTADLTVLKFIAKFTAWMPNDETDTIHDQFSQGNGYAFYFAHMLKLAFNRGSVMLAIPSKEIVWVDDDEHNNVAFDINGVYCYYDDVIPIEKFGTAIDKYKNVPGQRPFDPDERINVITKRWIKDRKE